MTTLSMSQFGACKIFDYDLFVNKMSYYSFSNIDSTNTFLPGHSIWEKKTVCRVYGHMRVWWNWANNVCECFIWLATCVCVGRWVFNEMSIHLKHSLAWPLAISVNEDVTGAASEQPRVTSPFDKGDSPNMPFIYLYFRLGVIYSSQWSHIDCIGLALFSSVVASTIQASVDCKFRSNHARVKHWQVPLFEKLFFCLRSLWEKYAEKILNNLK